MTQQADKLRITPTPTIMRLCVYAAYFPQPANVGPSLQYREARALPLPIPPAMLAPQVISEGPGRASYYSRAPS
jgi:hypothetical protein